MHYQTTQSQLIAGYAETTDLAYRHRADIRMMTKGFAGMHIREMDLHGRNGDRRQGISQRDAGMGQTAGIDENPGNTSVASGVNPIDQLAFVVGLKGIYSDPQFPRQKVQALVHILQRVPAIDFGFTGTEQIEIGTMQNQDLDICAAHRNSSRNRNSSRESR